MQSVGCSEASTGETCHEGCRLVDGRRDNLGKSHHLAGLLLPVLGQDGLCGSFVMAEARQDFFLQLFQGSVGKAIHLIDVMDVIDLQLQSKQQAENPERI